MSFEKRQKRRSPRKTALGKFDQDIPAMELERGRLLMEFGKNWVREYWRRHSVDYFTSEEKANDDSKRIRTTSHG